MSAAVASVPFLPYDEFLRAYDGVHAEWVDGTVVPMTPVTPRHQRVANFLTLLFQVYCEERDAGSVLSAPVQMKLARSAREPDVMVLLPEHAARITEAYVDGPADLVVEVVSPESRTRDRVEKLREYEQAGVREYWLIDPARQQADVYRLSDGGRFEAVPLGTPPRLASEVLPGVVIEAAWLWAEPLPKLSAVLREWGLP
jgi:Uma2 family endonuclease